MSNALSFLSSMVSIFALWVAFDAGYRPYRVNVLRDRLFQLRSELFELAKDGNLGANAFRDPAYVRVRHGLNGFIRHGHQFTPFRLLLLLWTSRWALDSERIAAERSSLVEAISKHTGSSKEKLTRIIREAEYAIVVHMMNVNVVGFVCLRVGECAARALRIQRSLKAEVLGLIEAHRALLAPLEADAAQFFL